MFMRVCCIAIVACAASVAVAEQGVPAAPAQIDVQLVDGALAGQLYSQAGQVIAGTRVTLHDTHGQLLAASETQQDGCFAFAATRPGVYLLDVAGRRTVVRAWAANTAPPTAAKAVLVTVGDSVRGRLGGHGEGGLGGIGGVGVLMVGGTIATVVTVATTNNSGS